MLKSLVLDYKSICRAQIKSCDLRFTGKILIFMVKHSGFKLRSILPFWGLLYAIFCEIQESKLFSC